MLSTTPLRTLRTRAGGVTSKRFASHGAPHYNEPTGYLFSEKPPAPGQKRVKEDWENIWYFGMFGSLGLAGVLLYYKPDTSIQGWALKEAKARMDARGEKVHYETPPL
ncbi:ESSS subunit of NADH:ubiquinone oxidoreductase [Lactarius pseudohatsudake]|nr:ESSS subunit of NADH:ubiquinone oxidoreductase [Lactarius pseudohatsudake]